MDATVILYFGWGIALFLAWGMPLAWYGCAWVRPSEPESDPIGDWAWALEADYTVGRVTRVRRHHLDTDCRPYAPCDSQYPAKVTLAWGQYLERRYGAPSGSNGHVNNRSHFDARADVTWPGYSI